MELIGYDYLADEPIPNRGLLRLAPEIDKERQNATSLLFDNGDFLQGTPLADELANSENHLLADAFNALDYDAITLGNHDFDYGLKSLNGFLAQLDCPIVSSNATGLGPVVHDHLILDRVLIGDAGEKKDIRIGVIGLLPPQTTSWNAHCLKQSVHIEDMVEAAKVASTRARENGADLVIALAHTGLDTTNPHPMMENALEPLSHLDCLDAIIGGHTHEKIDKAIASGNSRFGTVPIVQAGSRGCRLGVIDLMLTDRPRWSVIDWHARLVHPKPNSTTPQPSGSLLAAHENVRRQLAEPAGKSTRPLCNHFSALGFDDRVKLALQAFLHHVRDTASRIDLPLIACFTSFRSDGVFGSKNYLNTGDTIIKRRDLASIVPFNNPICMLEISAKNLRQWISQSSRHLTQIQPSESSQPLISGETPSYFFDQFCGLTYQLDLSQCPDDHRRRVPVFSIEGSPLTDEDRIAVVASTYRAYGGGGFIFTDPNTSVWESKFGARDIVAQFLKETDIFAPSDTPLWTFSPLQDSLVTLEFPEERQSIPALKGLAVLHMEGANRQLQLDLRELAPTG